MYCNGILIKVIKDPILTFSISLYLFLNSKLKANFILNYIEHQVKGKFSKKGKISKDFLSIDAFSVCILQG